MITRTPTELQAMEERMTHASLSGLQQRMPSMIRERTVAGSDRVSPQLPVGKT